MRPPPTRLQAEMKPRQVLFPEPATERDTALDWDEPLVHFTKEVTWPDAIADRAVLNAWYEDFPDENDRLAAKLSSEDNSDHRGAVYELLAYRLLSQRHEDVRYEEGGAGPDFRVYEREELILAVEVMTLRERADWARERKEFGRLAALINARVRRSDFALSIVEASVKKDPPVTQLVSFVQSFLDGLPAPDDVAQAVAAGGHLPNSRFVRDSVDVTIEAVPLRDRGHGSRRKESRNCGVGASHWRHGELCATSQGAASSEASISIRDRWSPLLGVRGSR
jgi:hypothetical protein